MGNIILQNAVTTKKDMEECQICLHNNYLNTTFEIVFTSEMKEIDIQLIGYFVLYKMKNPALQIILTFEKSLEDKLEARLSQYSYQSLIFNGFSIFTELRKYMREDEYGEAGYKIINLTKPNLENFVVTDDFLPILSFAVPTDKSSGFNLYEFLFTSNLSGIGSKKFLHYLNELPPGVKAVDGENNQFDEFKKWLVPRIEQIGREQAVYSFLFLTYVLILTRLRVTGIHYWKKERGIREPSITNIKYEKLLPYYLEIKPLIDDIQRNSPVHIFIFVTLLKEGVFPNTFSPETLDEIKDRAFNIWNFTKELVRGIYELAKNIISYVSPPYGVITGRVHSYKDTTKIFGDDLRGYTDTMVGFPHIEFNILDLGNSGVIPTLKKLLSDQRDKIVASGGKDYLTEEIQILENFTLSNLLLPKNDRNLLLFNSKRATAHLGLLLFSKLIYKNNGFLISSTNEGAKYQKHIITPDGNRLSSETRMFGTSFTVLLPLDFKNPFVPHSNVAAPSYPDSGVTDTSGIHELVKYTVFTIPPEPKDSGLIIDNSNIPIFRIVIKQNQVEEIWPHILECLSIQEKKFTGSALFCLDFCVQINDASTLFRLIGLWELEFPDKKLIITNLETEKFHNLLELNRYFIELNPHLPYWNRNAMVLFYTFIEIEQGGSGNNEKGKFYFMDILWGDTESEFSAINTIISKTNFNSTRILNTQKESIINRPKLPPNNLFFTSNLIPLPFDIILPSSTQNSIFEETAASLLQKELKTGMEKNN